MKTNVFHSERQASCDVLFYPITPEFLYFSDVKRPGRFRKKEIRRETEQKYCYDIMQPNLDTEHAVSNHQM